jgi:hypothetical protein
MTRRQAPVVAMDGAPIEAEAFRPPVKCLPNVEIFSR